MLVAICECEQNPSGRRGEARRSSGALLFHGRSGPPAGRVGCAGCWKTLRALGYLPQCMKPTTCIDAVQPSELSDIQQPTVRAEFRTHVCRIAVQVDTCPGSAASAFVS